MNIMYPSVGIGPLIGTGPEPEVSAMRIAVQMEKTMYYCVTPNRVIECSNAQVALKAARYADQHAKEINGRQAGADCFICRDDVAASHEINVIGLAAGRGIIRARKGHEFGCSDAIRGRIEAFRRVDAVKSVLESTDPRFRRLSDGAIAVKTGEWSTPGWSMCNQSMPGRWGHVITVGDEVMNLSTNEICELFEAVQ